MDLNMRLIELGWEIEKLPASEQQTKTITMLSDLREEISKKPILDKNKVFDIILTCSLEQNTHTDNWMNRAANEICSTFSPIFNKDTA